MGYSPSQTLFTSIHLDRLLWPVPASLEEAQFDQRGKNSGPKLNPTLAGNQSESVSRPKLISMVLRAYCLALIKTCDLVHATVSFEYYYEVGPTAESAP